MALDRNLVILVDREDSEIGTADKLEAHRAGQLHRALSVFIVNANGEMLLQRRAAQKYHSGGLWSNACCSHPCPGEQTADAALRRLREELGFGTELEQFGDWYYRAEVGGGLIEHELDHLYSGTWSGTAVPDPAEVSDMSWMSVAEIHARLAEDPEQFTAWFPEIFAAWEKWYFKNA